MNDIEKQLTQRYAERERKATEDYEEIFYSKKPIPCNPVIADRAEAYFYKKPLIIMTKVGDDNAKKPIFRSVSEACRELGLPRKTLDQCLTLGIPVRCDKLDCEITLRYQIKE